MLVPTAGAGIDTGELADLDVSTPGEETLEGLVASAVSTRETCAVDDLLDLYDTLC